MFVFSLNLAIFHFHKLDKLDHRNCPTFPCQMILKHLEKGQDSMIAHLVIMLGSIFQHEVHNHSILLIHLVRVLDSILEH